jgi:hypothetical protein
MQYGRRAFGHQRTMAPAAKARNVAASIRAHGLDVDAPATWGRYGLSTNTAQQALVRQALAQQ